MEVKMRGTSFRVKVTIMNFNLPEKKIVNVLTCPIFSYIFLVQFLCVLPIMPKTPEITWKLLGIQMETCVSISSDWNIRDDLWRWSTYFGQNICEPETF